MNAAGNETKIHRDDVDTCSNKEIYQAKLEDKHIFFSLKDRLLAAVWPQSDSNLFTYQFVPN